jgi:hypothetical protein
MQLVIDIKKQQDLQVLLLLLERLKIPYKQLPNQADENHKASPAGATRFSDKYAGKLSSEVSEVLQKHIAKSRNEWERHT